MGKLGQFYNTIPHLFSKKERRSSKTSDSLLIEPTTSQKITHIDVVDQAVGYIGRWQIEIFILMFIITTPSNWVELGIELFANETDFWCKQPNSNGTTKNSTLNQKTSKEICQIQKELNETQNVCPYGYEYNTSVVGTTIISEWNLVCDQHYLISITQILVMLGNLLGGVSFGIAADKCGRRPILIISCVLRFLFGILSGAAPGITTFIILRFFLALFDGGIPGIALVICLEVLGGKWRLIFAVLFEISFNLGFPVMALITYWLQNWRYAQVVLYASTILTVLCAWLAPESPRWLLAVGKKNKVVKQLEKAAIKNKRDPAVVEDLVKEYHDEDEDATEDFCFCMYLFTIPKLRNRTILSCINGVILFINTYGFYQLYGEFGQYPFWNLTIQGLTTIVGSIISALIVTTWSRRRTLAGTSFIMGVCSFLLIVLPKNAITQNTITAILFCCVGVMMSITEPLIGELFPTVLRNSGFGIFSVFVSIGAMISPVIVSLESVYWFLPNSIFSLLSFLEIIFVLLLPEIKDEELDETVEDVGI